jgi:hypothetical protein
MLYKQMASLSARLLLGAALFLSPDLAARADDPPAPAAPNLLADFNASDDTAYIDDPWGGVINGVLTVPPGVQFAVNEDGHVEPTVFGPSVASCDLNGDALPDLVVADPRGYFWYFPNSGTPTKPKFTGGEVMPIWIGEPVGPTSDGGLISGNYDAVDNTVPRIQLVDYTGEKKFSIVAGNYEGKLYYIHNTGTSTQPNFSMPENLNNITVPTYSGGKLWCNFLSPFLYDFTGNGQLDLITGEGTYASNSIYRLVNKGNNGSPIFNETLTTKIIPGYGREHLNPQVVDWNNDGKPDIITGERQGYIDLYLNNSPDNDPAHMTFADIETPPHVKFGGVEQLGILTTVSVADLTGNKLPNLLISNSDDHITYALNTGKLGAPKFDGPPAPIKGVNPFPKIFAPPPGWWILKAFSMPYFLLVSTKLKDDPTFKPPPEAPTIKSALKMYTVPHTHAYFPQEIYPAEDTHIISFARGIAFEAGSHYDLSFWVKTSGNVQNLRYFFAGGENLIAQGITGDNGEPGRYIFIENTIPAESAWTQVTADIYVEKANRHMVDHPSPAFYVAFNGAGGTVWMAGFSMTKKQDQDDNQ